MTHTSKMQRGFYGRAQHAALAAKPWGDPMNPLPNAPPPVPPPLPAQVLPYSTPGAAKGTIYAGFG
jgi:hypothetical protein